MSVLVVAEYTCGVIRPVTLELVSAARGLGGPVILAVIGSDPDAARAVCVDVDQVVHVQVQQAEFENDIYQRAVEALIAERAPDVVLLGFTVSSMGYAPAVAAKLGFGFASDVFALAREDDKIIATRALYGGKVHAELEFPRGRPVLVLLRQSVWPAAEPGVPPVVRDFVPEPCTSRARHLGFLDVASDDVDITASDFLLSIGRGVGEQENIAAFEQLAAKLGATLSVSRPLVDAGWVSNSRQVGLSGRTVKPKVYLAFGVSGASQHLAGMKSSEIIIAVNTDAEAAIFSVAHYAAVADMFEVADELSKLL